MKLIISYVILDHYPNNAASKFIENPAKPAQIQHATFSQTEMADCWKNYPDTDRQPKHKLGHT
jgi:hypothetical protein